MDERMLRALLGVMNADTNKAEDVKWYGEIVPVPGSTSDKGVAQRVQFWLLSDLYVIIHGVEGLVSS